MKRFRILYQDEELVAIDKPAGVLVHPPENEAHRKFTSGANDVIRILREQIGARIFPIHRLDRATSGVLLLATSSEAASLLQTEFQNQRVEKTYCALVRGFTTDSDKIVSPLRKDDDSDVFQDAQTYYETLMRFELPVASSRFASSRYSLVKVRPLTGRYHQIRRHFKHISHPLVGDTVHGDGVHNRIFRTLTEESILYLKAYRFSFRHPRTQELIHLRSRWNGSWQKIFDLAGSCPLI